MFALSATICSLFPPVSYPPEFSGNPSESSSLEKQCFSSSSFTTSKPIGFTLFKPIQLPYFLHPEEVTQNVEIAQRQDSELPVLSLSC